VLTEDKVFEHATVPATEGEIEALVWTAYHLRVSAKKLTGERDHNYRLAAESGVQYVLKVSHSAEDPIFTDLQTQALLHIAARDPSLPVPRILLTRTGMPQFPWTRPEADTSQVRLLSFLPGVGLREMPRNQATLSRVGAALARFDRALSDFQHPAQGRTLLWDLQHALRLETLLSTVDSVEERRLAQYGFNIFRDFAAPRLSKLRTQVIHNDLNPNNVLLSGDREPDVSGILDLGDALTAPLINDVAVAAAYHIGGAPDPLANALALIEGFNRVQPPRRIRASAACLSRRHKRDRGDVAVTRTVQSSG
jgi:hydroxylysine kinase